MLRRTVVRFMTTGHTCKSTIAFAHLGQLPCSNTEATLHPTMFKSVILTWIEGHSTVQPVPLCSLNHLNESGSVIQPKTISQYLVEDVNDSWMCQHPSKRLAPRPIKRQWVLMKLPATGSPFQMFRSVRQTRIAIGNQMCVAVNGFISQGHFV